MNTLTLDDLLEHDEPFAIDSAYIEYESPTTNALSEQELLDPADAEINL